MITRRRFIASLAGLGFTGCSGTAYAHFVESKWLENSKVHIDLSNKTLKKPIRLLHISDFHISRFVPPSFLEKAIDLGLSNNPDLICITGDFITTYIRHYEQYKDILQHLSDFAPTYACLGNHDGGIWAERWGGYSDTSEVVQLLRKSRITCLQNKSQIIEVNKQKLCIIGLGDIWAREFEPEKAFDNISSFSNIPKIVLSHNPDSKALLESYDWDLMLCGHTHGGQVVLPVIGAPYVPIIDRRYMQGLHLWEGRFIHITKGVGNILGLRFNCRPEVNLLTLT